MKKNYFPQEIFKEITNKTISALPNNIGFSNFDDLLFQAKDLRRLESYKNIPLKTEKKLIFFTWVIPSGLGDLAMQIHISNIIHKKNPKLCIELISLIEERSIIPKDLKSTLPHHIIRYSHPNPPIFSENILNLLQDAFSIIEIPTAYFDFFNFKQMIYENNPHPPIISRIGQYGFINTPDYNPSTKERCMGLYFLEKGIITLKRTPPKKRDLNTYFAYLITENGIQTYLLSIFLSRMNDQTTITIKTPSLGKILPVLKKMNFANTNIGKVHIKDAEHNTTLEIKKEGKEVKIEQLPPLSPSKIITLMASSNPFVGVRGDGSFTEALSTDAIFFYDALDHALPFLTDLENIALKELLPYFSLCNYLTQLKNTKTPPPQRAQTIAELLQCPSLIVGIEKLRNLLYEKYSFNQGLNNLIKKNFSLYNR